MLNNTVAPTSSHATTPTLKPATTNRNAANTRRTATTVGYATASKNYSKGYTALAVEATVLGRQNRIPVNNRVTKENAGN